MGVHVLEALGGLGLFLFGLIVLTEGLRSLAGDAVHRVLFRFTKSPVSGAFTGAAVTAVLQSSSVTTATTVGFVGAGLLTFAQALGVLFGANIGTTATGWMVALLGFEFEVEAFVHPLLLLGALLRLFGRGRFANAGQALAGFALLFLGLGAMQSGMAGFEGAVTPDSFPSDTLGGRLLLIGIGIGVTLVTQSSSAGMAAALTGLDAGAITLPQAAAMVIGMDIGTTSTTAFATLGGSVQMRRTGYAHVVYNAFTGLGAFLLLNPYLYLVERLWGGGVPPTLVLVGFHSVFNSLGVIAVLPFTKPFARLMERLVPDRGADLVGRLDAHLLREPAAAVVSLFAVVRDIGAELFAVVSEALSPTHEPECDAERLARVDASLDEARLFADEIRPPAEQARTRHYLVASMHAIDHLDRLVERCRSGGRIERVRSDPRLRELAVEVRHALDEASFSLRGDGSLQAEGRVRAARDRLREARRPFREDVLATVPGGTVRLDDAIHSLDAIRWLHRVVYHAWRILHNLESIRPTESQASAAEAAKALAAEDEIDGDADE